MSAGFGFYVLSLPYAHLRGTVRLYREIMVLGYRRYATYRGATVAGIFTNTVFGFMRAYVLIALFKSMPHVGGYDLADALTYIWLNQGMLMTIYIWGWYDIAERIRSGDVVTDLQRPVGFQGYWLAQDLGRALYHAIFRGVPPFIVGALFFRLHYPSNPAFLLLFPLSLTLAVGLSFAIRFLVNIAAFWVLDYRGIGYFAMAIWTLFSGSVVPLAILPEPWRTLTNFLPFAGMVQVPIDVFLGKYQGTALLGAILSQAGWALVLLLLGHRLLTIAARRLVIQGG